MVFLQEGFTCRGDLKVATVQSARAVPPVLQGDAWCLWPRLSRDSDRPTVCCDSSTTRCERRHFRKSSVSCYSVLNLLASLLFVMLSSCRLRLGECVRDGRSA